MKAIRGLFVTDNIRAFLIAIATYVSVSVFFLFGLITSRGDVAQQDWSIPITTSAAANQAHSFFYVWSYDGFGGAASGRWGFPFFPMLNAALAPLGFVGGNEIKLLSVFLVAFGGITAYLLARSFKLSFLSSFLSGLFFMTTAVVFNWLMFGWIFYLLAYDLLPLMILITKKFLEKSDLRYLLLNALIFALAFEQPSFILIYPLFGFMFTIFESRANLKILLRGIMFIVGSLSIYFLISLSFFVSFNYSQGFSFYHGNFYHTISSQFQHLSSIIDPIRLWGSTFNYQFETYFPTGLILFSFIPLIIAAIVLLLKPNNRRVLFFSLTYLFVLVSYGLYANLSFFVYNLPYGTIFEAPSIFLVPASLSLAMLIGYAHQSLSHTFRRILKGLHSNLVRIACFTIILIVIVSAGAPWWAGQASGTPYYGPPTKLNLYSIPPDYTAWSNHVKADDAYFVLYVPFNVNSIITDNENFGLPYQGVNGAIFVLNDFPHVSVFNTTLLLNKLEEGNSPNSSLQVGETWGSYSIKYIVVYTNVEGSDNITQLLSRQSGIIEVVSLEDVVVYEDIYAKPVVYTNSSNASTEILSQDPTMYKIQANSSSPYTIMLNQAYSAGWRASVNGTKLTTHFETDIGFNGWYVNYTGNMKVDIYYEPQTTYVISTIISVITIVSILTYLVIATVLKYRRRTIS
jgi:hypothetical protein